MREEDIDWSVYHLILQQKECSTEWLTINCVYELEILTSSLNRLKKYYLIEEIANGWHACHLNEIILKNQFRDVFCDGLELSGGTIRFQPPVTEGEE